MNRINNPILAIIIAMFMMVPMTTMAGLVSPFPAVEEELVSEKNEPLKFKENISVQDIEQYLGRKMTALEKLGFKLNKKKLVKALNAPYAMSEATNTWAIVGFVCSLIIPILGIIFSAIALGQIKRSGERGRGLAIAGLIIGIVSLIIGILLVI